MSAKLKSGRSTMCLMMNKLLLLGAFAAAGRCLFGGMTVDLSGRWTLEGADQMGAKVVCPIAVPGGVHSALLAAGLMPDTFREDNELETLWVARRDWTVSRTFDVSAELLARKEVLLRLEDCDTFCTVRVNGTVVGRTSDRFRRWEFDVRKALKPGRNEISGFFESPVRIADGLFYSYGRFYPMSNAKYAFNQAFIRKPACHGGWDWGPELEVMGFCGTVALVASDRPRIDYVYTTQRFNNDLSHCTLDVFADLSDGTTVTNRLEIDNPPLWWPNGAGERNFYTFTVDVNGEKVTKKIGLRKLEVLNERTVSADGKDELSMVFRVNNRRLFMKGANWIPCDAYENRQTPERYRDLLESAVAANMNMIRLWGGGQYEKDVFYDTCDELGLLVWHDMMASCAVYPGDDRFLGQIRAELSHQLRRLRDHASIALWCGDNECLGALRWFPQLNYDREGYKAEWVKRSRLQDECVARYDPTRTYWPSSPCCGPGDFGDGWKNDSKGDMHVWDVWGANRPLEDYYRFRPRFCSEFGFQSFPSMEVALTFASEADILAHEWNFEYHQKAKGGNDRIRKTMLRYFGELKDVPSELLLSQFQQGLAIKTAVDAWRAQRPRCMGTLFWQLNDNWPVSSWSSVEYGGKWKPLQYMAKRFFAPLGIVAAPDGTVTALNDTDRRQEGFVTLDYVGFDGKVIRSEKADVVLEPDSATKVASFRPQEGAFLHLSLRVTDGEAENDWLFSRYCESALASPDLKVEVLGQPNPSEFRLRLTASAPAFFVWANVRGVRGEFDDNCLTVLPGKPREIVFHAKEDCSLRLFKERMSVAHLAMLIK